MAKLKIGGIWTGMLYVNLETWTISMLREDVANKSNCNPNSINLICDGKILNDGDGQRKLTQLGIQNNAEILITHICAEQGKVIKQEITTDEKRSHTLTRVKEAAIALGKSHADGLLPLEDFDIYVEDESGKNVMSDSETDQRAILMGLILHINAKRLIRQQNYKDALQMLLLAEEVFSPCDPEAIELIVNIPILQINMVWCYYMMRDISSLPEATERLEMAREGLDRVSENNSLRVRPLQKACYPELALHLRLELLEGVVAYYSGRLDTAKEALMKAKAKLEQLQVSDELLSLITGMGFAECDAKRALKICNQNEKEAIDFLLKKEQKQIEDSQIRNEIWEQKLYGMTSLKKLVNRKILKDLVSFGFEKEVAAEALRINENDIQKSLDDLTNPQTTSALQICIESRKRKREQLERDPEIETFVQMGFERSRVIDAFEAGGNADEALEILVAEPNMEAGAEANSSATPSGGASSSSSLPHNASVGDVQGSSHLINAPEVEMENEFYADIAKSEALAEYDNEVNIEGEAIAEYLSLVESALRRSKGKEKQEDDSE